MSIVNIETPTLQGYIILTISMTLLDTSDIANDRYFVECNMQVRLDAPASPYERDNVTYTITGIAQAGDLAAAQDLAIVRALDVASRYIK